MNADAHAAIFGDRGYGANKVGVVFPQLFFAIGPIKGKFFKAVALFGQAVAVPIGSRAGATARWFARRARDSGSHKGDGAIGQAGSTHGAQTVLIALDDLVASF